MTLLPTITLILLIISLIVNVLLALLVLRNNPKSATNRLYVLLAAIISIWLVINYLSVNPAFIDSTLMLIRLSIVFAMPLSTIFFLFSYTVPEQRITLSKKMLWGIVGITFVVMLINVSPLAFVDVSINEFGAIPVPGPGIIPFAFFSTLFSFLAIFFLGKKIRKGNLKTKKQLTPVFMGILYMLGLIILTVFIPTLFFERSPFVPLIPLYTIIFLGMTAYAIVQHQLFNAKIIATQALTISLWIVLFAKMLANKDQSEFIIDLLIFAVTFIFGLILIRSVIKEVEAREEIEILAKDLEKANVRLRELDKLKSEFVSIASHQLRSPLTAVKGYASLILEGSFGRAPEAIKEAVQKIFDSSQTMVSSVEDFLNVSRIEQGRMKYEMSVFDVGELAKKVIEELKPVAEKKKLKLSYLLESKSNQVKADVGKIKQVIGNLVDNAIKYTEKGSVNVNVSQSDGKTRIEITDTGIGIKAGTLPRLFDRFVRDKDARKVNVSGSGLGLYVAKQLVEGHKGKIWAESEGEGKGSRFIIELSTYF